MATKIDEINDAMVDTYRALREVNRKAAETPTATKPITSGAGVDPRRVCKPSKRLRNWHRKSGAGGALKAYVRVIAIGADVATVASWLANKKAVR